jgi:hypothetical protein
LVYAGRPIGIGVRDVLSATGPHMLAAIITVAIGLGVQRAFLLESTEVVRFIASILICILSYLVSTVGVFGITDPLKLMTSVMRDLNPLKRMA